MPIIAAIILLLLCGLRLFIKSQGYKATFGLLLFLYSLAFCFMALPILVFIHSTGMKILIYAMTGINLIVSILILRKLRKEISE